MVRTVKLSDEAYEELSLKRHGESFSELVRRAAISLRQERMMEAVGAWQRLGIDGDEVLARLYRARDEPGRPRSRPDRS